MEDTSPQPERTEASLAERLSFPLRAFIHAEAASGILLLACALVALVWANSPWAAAYDALWATELTLGTVQINLNETLRHWVNDGLMAVFFLVVGLEIKREVLAGELASPRRAALPAVAAVGGAVVPAAIFLLINWGSPGAQAWGVPMATDIAFALGVLALLGSRVPAGLKVFLTALAIVDDILAVLVIAVFYTASVDVGALAGAAVVLALLVAANRLGVRALWVYALLGVALWAAVFASGIHATVAGVLLAFTIPANTRIDPAAFVARGRGLIADFERACAASASASILNDGVRQDALVELEDAVEAAGAPLQRMEQALHPWVAFAIVPIFALANAGVRIEGDLGAAFGNTVTIGVVVGLVVGKQLGVLAAAWLVVRAGLTELPPGVGWRHVYGAGWLAGIGFTMALFVADLAFADAAEAPLLASAKLGILAASVVAGVGGAVVLGRATGRRAG
ncbi:MAG: Na+/H+ antiporter NhaA type [uncultured Thermomicrobiales bacterium]|uniref:Na(+)/H(+) antiporter NhaA n=1 Tax=uncultured Thermomicrobiales bacterium TaxID=1645740 RepID=A0A6J4U121_9BACT|nr:MAG: Na+/H+ antiporter NhaA type [uncultured Thermomicrobiales bacterium]